MLADNITDHLIADLLGDFVRRPLRMTVEDDIDLTAYDDKWPFNVERKQAEAEQERLAKQREDQEVARQR